MKVKRIALFGAALTTLTTAASAQVTIRITGSTAFRGATHEAIRKILNSGFTYGYTGTNFQGASQAIFIGTTKAPTNTSVIIKTSWAGSVGGIKTLAQLQNVDTWFEDPDQAEPHDNDNTVTTSTGGVQSLSASGANIESAPPTVAMSDSFQNSTEFRTPVLQDRIVGVIPFQWVRNAGSPLAMNNMTPLLTAALLSGGLPLSQFTGNPADSLPVYAVGRDEDSGTRLTAFAESAFGIFATPTQHQVNGNPITQIRLYPENTILGVTYAEGHSGYPGGGNLVTAMNATGSSTAASAPVFGPGWLIGYAGVSDARNVVPGTAPVLSATVSGGAVTGVTITNGGTNLGASTVVTFGSPGSGAAATVTVSPAGVITAVNVTAGGTGYTSAPTVTAGAGAAMAWNGYTYSPQAVREGQYTFWGYQHLLYRTGYTQAAIANQLADQIKNEDATTSGILLSTMNVGRAVEGGVVTYGNPYP